MIQLIVALIIGVSAQAAETGTRDLSTRLLDNADLSSVITLGLTDGDSVLSVLCKDLKSSDAWTFFQASNVSPTLKSMIESKERACVGISKDSFAVLNGLISSRGRLFESKAEEIFAARRAQIHAIIEMIISNQQQNK